MKAVSCYLFVHFRETTSPEGEQVYFGLSRDGFRWEALNDGCPVLWAYYGDHGVRDMTVIRSRENGRFHIFATDLSLSYGMRGKYQHSWENIRRHGSHDLAHWESDDLVHWSEEDMIPIGNEKTGCIWAPDILFDPKREDYVLHYSYCGAENGYGPMAIYYSRTKDFRTYTEPALLYRKEGCGCIDSALYEEDGKYYLFVKSEKDPERVILLRGPSVTGPFERVSAFDESMTVCAEGLYEAPTAVRLSDGRWLLFVDYYGVRGAGQGYVPFVADSLSSGAFTCYEQARGEGVNAPFTFPYGFKHGTILPITDEEYARIASHDWNKE